MRVLALALAVLMASPAVAQDHQSRTEAVLTGHVLPGFTRLAQATKTLSATAQGSCDHDSRDMRAAFDRTFDAWAGVSHLRFGPTETEDRGFAMAFWPDSKGFTKKALNRLIATENPVVRDPAAFAKLSIAGRGLFALEYLLFDETLRQTGTGEYRCALAIAIAVDLDANATAVLADWSGGYMAQMLNAGADSPYRSDADALQAVYQSLVSGLQFNAETRLGRPLGTFDRPRPRRAEAWRSGRSLRNLAVSLRALSELSGLLAAGHDEIAGKLGADFNRLAGMIQSLDDPAFAGVADPMMRFRIEAVQSAIAATHLTAAGALGAALGVAEGFNALDGD